MVSLLDVASWSNDVYKDSGWDTQYLEEVSEFEQGVRANLYKKDGENWLVFRGTKTLANYLTDAKLVVTNKIDNTRIMEAAVKWALSECSNSKCYFAGHSLGGGYATMAVYKSKTAAVVFNSPYQIKNLVYNSPTVPVVNFCMRGDPISRSNPKEYNVGKAVRVRGGFGHSMDTMHAALKIQTNCALPLQAVDHRAHDYFLPENAKNFH